MLFKRFEMGNCTQYRISIRLTAHQYKGGLGQMFIMASLIGTKLPEQMATSSNPWAYLVGVLLVALLGIGAYTLKWLVKLDTTHREESSKREEKLNFQLDKSIEATGSLVDTQKEMIIAITGVQSNLHELKTETNNRLGELERIVKKESA